MLDLAYYRHTAHHAIDEGSVDRGCIRCHFSPQGHMQESAELLVTFEPARAIAGVQLLKRHVWYVVQLLDRLGTQGFCPRFPVCYVNFSSSCRLLGMHDHFIHHGMKLSCHLRWYSQWVSSLQCRTDCFPWLHFYGQNWWYQALLGLIPCTGCLVTSTFTTSWCELARRAQCSLALLSRRHQRVRSNKWVEVPVKIVSCPGNHCLPEHSHHGQAQRPRIDLRLLGLIHELLLRLIPDLAL